MENGTSLMSTRSLLLLFVLSQILNVHELPLAIPCISACLNIIITGGLRGAWWKGHNQWTRKGDYIKKGEWVLDVELVKKNKSNKHARLVSIALTSSWGLCTWAVGWENSKSRNRLMKDNQLRIVETSISYPVPHYFFCRHVSVLRGGPTSELCLIGKRLTQIKALLLCRDPKFSLWRLGRK